MAKIDVRNNLNVTELAFSDKYSIVGDGVSTLIAIREVGQPTDRIICDKADIDNLIKALNVSKKVW